MTAVGVLVNIILFVCFSGEITLARDDRESSEMNSKIDSMVHTLQGICIQDNPDQTVNQLKKHTQTMLNNIGLYKDIVKLNKQLKNEIKWIVKESNGPETNRLIELLKRDAKEVCDVLPKKKPKFKDCTEIKEKSKKNLESGVYTIHLRGTSSVQAYCDMTTDGGGWTVIHKRLDGTGGYNRKWTECENGYGDITNEFWFGNNYTHILTSSGKYELRVDMIDKNKKKWYAVYKTFVVGDPTSKYKLTVGDYSGNAGDRLTYHNGMKFTTVDQDNDPYSSSNCAQLQEGAWWYKSCSSCDLSRGHGKSYKPYWGSGRDLIESVMMIRKT